MMARHGLADCCITWTSFGAESDVAWACRRRIRLGTMIRLSGMKNIIGIAK